MLPSGVKEIPASTLVLHNVTRLDKGVYICRASNGVEAAVEARIQLTIICKSIV